VVIFDTKKGLNKYRRFWVVFVLFLNVRTTVGTRSKFSD